MHDITPLPSLLGGMLIGLAATIFLFTHGRVAGISGLYAGAIRPGTSDRGIRAAFILGVIVAGFLANLVAPGVFATTWNASLPVVGVAGVLVGVGTQVGNGCTSGHGVCGLSRLSVRSLAATIAFILSAGVTVFIVRHVVGATR